jgi:eukaryotic-like serine/threonine-protein kinase
VVAAGELAGRYRLIEPIGRGHLADVWRAKDATLGRQVAVKVWNAPDVAEGDAAVRAWRDARDAARLVHPHVARVYDIGADGGRLFLVTELVSGRDLAAVLAQFGPLPAVHVARIGAQAARVLGAAHAQGFVHGGVKPGNVFIAADGSIKLTDFGTSGSDSAAARVPPERAAGLPAGPAGDLYALGCVLYELLVGHPPRTEHDDFPDSPEPALRRHVEDEPAPPGRLRPDIPAEMEHVVLRMLAKNPADRPARADRIAAAFQAIEAIQSLGDDS